MGFLIVWVCEYSIAIVATFPIYIYYIFDVRWSLGLMEVSNTVQIIRTYLVYGMYIFLFNDRM